MYFIGSNNSREVSQETVENYINGNHRVSSVFGLAKGNYFWAKDITFESSVQAQGFIKSYESKGFKVHHNIEMGKAEVEEKVDLVEEVKRKGTGRSRRKE